MSLASVDLFEIFMTILRFVLSDSSALTRPNLQSLLTDILNGDLITRLLSLMQKPQTYLSGHFNNYRIVFEDNATVLVGALQS